MKFYIVTNNIDLTNEAFTNKREALKAKKSLKWATAYKMEKGNDGVDRVVSTI